MGKWTEVEDDATLDRALACCRGDYQIAVVRGDHNLSGSSLKGAMKDRADSYTQSRNGLMRRMSEAGLAVSERKGDRGARILIIGSGDDPVVMLAKESLKEAAKEAATGS